MREFVKKLNDRLTSFVDWFIPAKLKASSDLLQGVRMFLFSHLFGPFLGHTISFSMLYLWNSGSLPSYNCKRLTNRGITICKNSLARSWASGSSM